MTYLIAQQVAEASQDLPTYEALFLKMLLAMIFIVAMAVLILKYVVPRISSFQKNKGDSEIQVLDRHGLEPRKGIYLVKIKNKVLAIGVADHNMTKLSEWEDDS